VDSDIYAHRVLMLQAATSYELNDMPTCKSLVDQMLPDEPETIVNAACILFRFVALRFRPVTCIAVTTCVLASCREEKFEEARLKFVDAITASGYAADLAYNIALCYYRQGQYGPALKHIAEIIEKGVREHPELSVGSNTDGIEVRRLLTSFWVGDF
jgi:tetratricopeptide repeat protein 30